MRKVLFYWSIKWCTDEVQNTQHHSSFIFSKKIFFLWEVQIFSFRAQSVKVLHNFDSNTAQLVTFLKAVIHALREKGNAQKYSTERRTSIFTWVAENTWKHHNDSIIKNIFLLRGHTKENNRLAIFFVEKLKKVLRY